jgi:hypothetical protein
MTVIKNLFTKIKSLSIVQILAIVLVVIGLGLVIVFGLRSIQSFRMLQYAQEQGFYEGAPDPTAIRPWMTVRYVAVVYTVPQEYLFAKLDIPFDRRNSNASLAELNREFELGRSSRGAYPAIMDKVVAAIDQYRANPVTTGLEGDVRPWMSIQYISNSTGVPAEFIFEQIGLPQNDTTFLPLERLADETKYPGGLRLLVEAVQQALTQYQPEENQ